MTEPSTSVNVTSSSELNTLSKKDVPASPVALPNLVQSFPLL